MFIATFRLKQISRISATETALVNILVDSPKGLMGFLDYRPQNLRLRVYQGLRISPRHAWLLGLVALKLAMGSPAISPQALY